MHSPTPYSKARTPIMPSHQVLFRIMSAGGRAPEGSVPGESIRKGCQERNIQLFRHSVRVSGDSRQPSHHSLWVISGAYRSSHPPSLTDQSLAAKKVLLARSSQDRLDRVRKGEMSSKAKRTRKRPLAPHTRKAMPYCAALRCPALLSLYEYARTAYLHGNAIPC